MARKPKVQTDDFGDPIETPAAGAEAKDGESLLGMPMSAFNAHEIGFIEAELGKYVEVLQKDARFEFIINEGILALLEAKRIDTRVATMTKNASRETGDELDINRMQKRRSECVATYTAMLEKMGFMPSLEPEDRADEETLVDIHRRYIAEIRAREAKGDEIGRPSQDARALAESVGRNPDLHKLPAAEKKVRDTVIKESGLEDGG